MNSVLASLGRYYFQTAYVVRSLEAAERWFERVLGIPLWTRMEISLGAECSYRGRPADSAMRLALGYAGEVQIELIEPVRGASIYEEFLESKGTGLHHVAFAVPEFEATVAALRGEGLVVLSEGVVGGVRFAYFDGTSGDASVIEILGFDATAAAAMAQMKAAAYAARAL